MKNLNNNFLFVGGIHWILSFFTDSMIFNDITRDNFFSFALCKILLLGIILFIWQCVSWVKDNNDKGKFIKNIMHKSKGYFLVILLFIVCAWPLNIAWGDMINIFNQTVNYNYAYKYHYITSLFHILSKMLIPLVSGPMIIQGFLYIVLIGWTIVKIESIFGKSYTKFGYIFFALLPMLYYTLYPNRMPLFSMTYLWLFEILVFDYFNIEKNVSRKKIACVILLASLVAVWRSESIYLVLITPLVISNLYVEKNNRSKVGIISFSVMLCLMVIMSVPQIIGTDKEKIDYGRIQKNALLGYTVTTMMYEGIDLEKNEEILDEINEVLSIEAVKRVLADYGKHCYRESYVSFVGGEYYGYQEAKKEKYAVFERNCYKFFLKNLDVFFEAKWNAFVYAATNQRPFADNNSDVIVKESYQFRNGEKQLMLIDTPNQIMKSGYNTIVSAAGSYFAEFQGKILGYIKLLFYNLFIPVLIVLITFLWSIYRKRWTITFITGGNIIHLLIVFLGAYAGYFMYYLPMYMVGYFYFLILILLIKYIKFETKKRRRT